jgi:hypothetical protein
MKQAAKQGHEGDGTGYFDGYQRQADAAEF